MISAQSLFVLTIVVIVLYPFCAYLFEILLAVTVIIIIVVVVDVAFVIGAIGQRSRCVFWVRLLLLLLPLLLLWYALNFVATYSFHIPIKILVNGNHIGFYVILF